MDQKVEYRTLGRTGLKVSAVGFGAAEIGYENAPAEDVQSIVNAALDAGVNVFDTAACYGESETMLGRALGSRRQDIFLFTKCGHASAAGFEGADWDPAMLVRSIDRSLRRLGTDRVDLLQLHSCSAEELRKGAAVEVLQRARDAGKTRFIGYSGDSKDALYAVRLGVFDTLQTSVSIADQESIDLTVPEAAQGGMGVIAKRSIGNAAWKYDSLPPDPYIQTYWKRLRTLDYRFLRGDAGEATATALRFTLAVPGVTVAIVGTKNPARWKMNSRVPEKGPLPPGEFAAIREKWRNTARADWTGQI